MSVEIALYKENTHTCTHPEEGLWCHHLEACCIPVWECVRVRHIRKTSALQACTAFSVSFRNSRHTLTSAKYQNEESVDKLFLQTSMFSSCCRDCVLLCIYGHTFTVCEKCRDFHFTFMKAASFFFGEAMQALSSPPALCLPLVSMDTNHWRCALPSVCVRVNYHLSESVKCLKGLHTSKVMKLSHFRNWPTPTSPCAGLLSPSWNWCGLT